MAKQTRRINNLSEARELFETHLRDERDSSEHTLRAYAADLKDFDEFLTDWAQKPVPLDQIDALAVRGYLGFLYRKGVSSTTVNRHLSSIRSLFRFLRREGFSVTDPAGEVPSAKENRPLPTFLPVDDAVRLMELPDTSTPEGKRDKAIFELLYGSGLRVSELTGLNRSDLSMEERLIRVRGKGRKERIVPITKEAAKAVESLLAQAETDPNEDSPLFTNKRNKRISPAFVRSIFRAYEKKGGFSYHFTPHALRHTAATHLLESQEADLRSIQELLGHASLSTTQRYTQVDFSHLRAVYDDAHPRAKMKPDRGR
ncbi:MAG: tyrosine recombinase XerC [Nitrospinae bacterium]|nr:tyrosine recombinase XerC [Nitrospinota bacterium]